MRFLTSGAVLKKTFKNKEWRNNDDGVLCLVFKIYFACNEPVLKMFSRRDNGDGVLFKKKEVSVFNFFLLKSVSSIYGDFQTVLFV